jgi:hypothetical protein
MSDNVESVKMKKCTLCSQNYPEEGWKMKANGELYRTCEHCRIRERDAYRKKALAPEFIERRKELQKENYNTQDAYDKRELDSKVRVKCPDCDKEMGQRGLRAHVKNKSCKGRNPVV